MKRHVYVMLSAFLAFSLAGCTGNEPVEMLDPAVLEEAVSESEAVPEPEDDDADADVSDAEPSADDDEAIPEDAKRALGFVNQSKSKGKDNLEDYRPVLNETCDLIMNGFKEDDRFEYTPAGVMDMANWMEKEELLASIGYNIEDINDDGIAELFIGTVPDDDEDANELFGGYTLENGKPVNFLEGWSRNMFQWLGNGRFYYFGSGGAAYSAFGTYHLEPNDTQLTCEDFYFTDTKGDNYEDIFFYHNTTGAWDSSASEEIEMSDEEFWDISDDMVSGLLAMKMTPFADYPYEADSADADDSKVHADYLEDVKDKFPVYEEAEEAGGVTPKEADAMVLFYADEDVKDFRLLSLSINDIDDNGDIDYDMTEAFFMKELKADTPVAIPISFPGDMPTNGFSYKDADGNVKTFALSQSGYDGSLMAIPIDD